MAETPEVQSSDTKQYFILGIIVLIAVAVAGYMLRNKTSMLTTNVPVTPTQAPVATPTPGPITGLTCDLQYYNPVIGFAKYYLSVEGGDVSTASKVTCEFKATQDNKEVASATVTSPLTAAPQRGGGTFRCTTKALDLKPATPTTVDISLKDDLGVTATCSAPFVFPAP